LVARAGRNKQNERRIFAVAAGAAALVAILIATLDF
jgi:hypothetical protein